MGVHVTDEETVALYDSVTGRAFGLTFGSEEEAQHFLDWANARDMSDPRTWDPAHFESVHAEWFAETHDGEGMFIGDLEDDEDDES